MLRKLTGKCLDLFDQCLSLEELSGAQAAWFEDCRARLRWWSFGLKVQSLGRSSLDRRLSHRVDVRNAIADILTGLAEALGECILEPRPLGFRNNDDSDSGHSDASSPMSVNSVLSDASSDGATHLKQGPGDSTAHRTYFIEMSLGSLLRLSVFIRKAGDKLRYKRADDDLRRIQTHAPETYAEFKAHLETLVLVGPSEHSLLTRLDSAATRNEIPQSVNIVIRSWINNRLGPIQRRLIEANIIRRHRIMCSRRDSRQAVSTSAQVKPPSRPAAAITRPSTPSAPYPGEAIRTAETTQAGLSHPVSIPRIVEEAATIQTATAAGSDLNTTAVRSGRASSVVSKLTRTGQNQDYPRTSILDKSPLCPYCGFVLNLEYAKNEKKWQ